MTLTFKAGVSLVGVKPWTVAGISVAHGIYSDHGLACVVTSVCDVAPGRVHNTKHAFGDAFDLRLPSRMGATPSCDEKVAAELTSALGPEWFVLLHGVDTSRHIHVQYNGKTA